MTYSTMPKSLPWELERREWDGDTYTYRLVNKEWDAFGAIGEIYWHGDDIVEQNAAYAVHAANSYPRLVEALEFYAKASVLYMSHRTKANHDDYLEIQDNGATARAALQEAGEQS